MDEIDIESARLDFLMAQKLKRQEAIIEENEGLYWQKPKAGTEEFPHEYPDVVIPKRKRV